MPTERPEIRADDDWDPRASDVLDDQVAAYDALRERCPVAHSEFLGWSVLRHADVLAVLDDHATFSNRVSARTSSRAAGVNAMDPPDHAAHRAVVDRYFTTELVAAFEGPLRAITREVLGQATSGRDRAEVMSEIAEPLAARAQCAYLGWPDETATALRTWADDSASATLARDRAELDRVAARFDRIIGDVLAHARSAGPDAPATLTMRLLGERVDGAALSDAQLVAMLRNWTAGEVGTIAAAIGIVIEGVARQPDVQSSLRARPDRRQDAMDELLRLQAPLIANRRQTTRPVELGGRLIPADAPVTILWPAAQRDPDAFPDATGFDPERDRGADLLYGRGIHACPGEGLARLELEVMLDELFRHLPAFRLASSGATSRAGYPAGGFTAVHIEWATPGVGYGLLGQAISPEHSGHSSAR